MLTDHGLFGDPFWQLFNGPRSNITLTKRHDRETKLDPCKRKRPERTRRETSQVTFGVSAQPSNEGNQATE